METATRVLLVCFLWFSSIYYSLPKFCFFIGFNKYKGFVCVSGFQKKIILTIHSQLTFLIFVNQNPVLMFAEGETKWFIIYNTYTGVNFTYSSYSLKRGWIGQISLGYRGLKYVYV